MVLAYCEEVKWIVALGGDRRCLGIATPAPMQTDLSVQVLFCSCWGGVMDQGLYSPFVDLGEFWRSSLGKKLVSAEKLSDACAFRIAKGVSYSALSF